MVKTTKAVNLVFSVLIISMVFLSTPALASPQLVAASYQNFSAANNTLDTAEIVKLKNIGDSTAYNVSASIYSPDNTTKIMNWDSEEEATLLAGESFFINLSLNWTDVSRPLPTDDNFALGSGGTVVTEGWEGVIDGDRSDLNSGTSGWNTIFLDLPDIYYVNNTRLYLYSGTCTGSGCGAYYKNYKLYFSLDNVSWELIAEGEDYSVPNDVIIDFDARPIKYVKLMGKRWQRDGWGYTYGATFIMREIELYGALKTYNEPVINIYYNDSVNRRRFLSNIKIEDIDDPIDSYLDSMIHEPKLRVSAPENYSYSEDNSISLVYTNPHSKTISNGSIRVIYEFLNGTQAQYSEQNLDLQTGDSEVTFSWNPSDYGADIAGKSILITASAADHQGAVLDERTLEVQVEDSLQITGFSPEQDITIDEGASQEFSVTAVSEQGTIYYKWFFNEVEIPEENLSVYAYEADYQSNGSHAVRVEASNDELTDSVEWNLTINNVNRPPVLEELSNISIFLGETVLISPVAFDPDNDTLTITLESDLNFFESNGSWLSVPNETGSYFANITADDNMSGIDSKTISITVSKKQEKQESSPPPSGGSGGGGGSSGNPLPQCNANIGNLEPNQTGSDSCGNAEDVYVSQVTVTAKNEIKNGVVQIVRYGARPNSVNEPHSGAFAYLSIKPVNFKSEDIERAEIYFLISRSWLKENGLEEAAGVLYRNVGGDWDERKGEHSSSTSDLVVFRVEVDGFSYFAIGAVKEEPEPQSEPENSTIQVSASAEPEPEPEPESPTMFLTFARLKNSRIGWLLGAVLLAGLVAYGYHTHRINAPRNAGLRLKRSVSGLRQKIRMPSLTLPNLGISSRLSRLKSLKPNFPAFRRAEEKPLQVPAYPEYLTHPKPITPSGRMEAKLEVMGEREREILNVLLKQGGRTTAAKIYHATGIPTSSLYRWLDKLERKGVLENQTFGKVRKVKLSEKFKE